MMKSVKNIAVVLCFCLATTTVECTEKIVVTTVSPKISPIEWSEKATGEFLAVRRSSLQMRNKGTLAKVLGKEGDRVKKGRLLAQLELVNFQLAVDSAEKRLRYAVAGKKASEAGLEVAKSGIRQAEARLETSAKDFDRAKVLKSKESMTQAYYDQSEGSFKASQAGLDMAKKQAEQAISTDSLSQTQVEMAEVDLKAARQQLEESSLVAPFDGLIVSAPMKEFEHPGDGQILFTLVDDSELELIVKMPERFLPIVKPGTGLNFKTELKRETIPASVSLVIPSVDPVNRTFTFKSFIPNPDGHFRHGSYADVNVILSRKENAALLPREAVKADGKDTSHGSIFLVEKGKIRKVEVGLGIERGGLIEVQDSLTPESAVVLMGVDKAADGMEVTVKNAEK